MYGKFFSSTFTGSMFGAGSDVFAVWGYVIANTVNSSVELNPKMLAAALGTEVHKVEMAIEFLCRPDPASRNKDHDGCRLIHESAFQYKVVSHAHYRSIQNEEERREYNRRKQQESRSRRKKTKVSKHGVIDSQSQLPKSKMSAHTEAEANTNTGKQNRAPSAALAGFDLPTWVPAEPWGAWLEVRRKKRAANTVHALNLAVKVLDRLRAQGNSVVAVLEQSTLKSYTGLFPVNGNCSAPIHAQGIRVTDPGPEMTEDEARRVREGIARKQYAHWLTRSEGYRKANPMKQPEGWEE